MKKIYILLPLLLTFLLPLVLASAPSLHTPIPDFTLEPGNNYVGLIDFDDHFTEFSDIAMQFRIGVGSFGCTIVGIKSLTDDAFCTDFNNEYGVVFVLYVGSNYIEFDVLSADDSIDITIEARVSAGLSDGENPVEFSPSEYFDITLGTEEEEPEEPEGLLDGLDGLVSYWDFDGDALDSHGNNDGTVSGATLTTGKINQGYDFGTSSDNYYIDSNINVDGWDEMTISLWVEHPNKNVDIIGDWSGTFSGTFFFAYVSGQYRFMIRDKSNTALDAGIVGSYSSGFNHFVLTYKRNEYIKLYKNGVEIGSNSADNYAIGGTGTTRNFYFGERRFGTTYLEGSIDESGIWNRALTPSEVEDLYINELTYSEFGETQEDTSTIEGYVIARDQNLNEFPLRNAFITLRDDNNEIVGERETGLNGDYRFSSFPVGNYDFITINDEGVTVPIDTNLVLTSSLLMIDNYIYDVTVPETTLSLGSFNVETQEGSLVLNSEDANIILEKDNYFLYADKIAIEYTYNGENFYHTLPLPSPAFQCIAPPDSIIEVCGNSEKIYIFTLDSGTLENFKVIGFADVSLYVNNVKTAETNEVTVTIQTAEMKSIQGRVMAEDQTSSQFPLRNVFLTLRDGDNNIISDTTTDSMGEFVFSNLETEIYNVYINDEGVTVPLSTNINLVTSVILPDYIYYLTAPETVLSLGSFTVPEQLGSNELTLEEANIILSKDNYFLNVDEIEIQYNYNGVTYNEFIDIDAPSTTCLNVESIIEVCGNREELFIFTLEAGTLNNFKLIGRTDVSLYENNVRTDETNTVLVTVTDSGLLQKKYFEDVTLNINDGISFNLDDYFFNYNQVQVLFFSDEEETTLEDLSILKSEETTNSFSNEFLIINLTSDTEKIILNINSSSKNFSTPVYINVIYESDLVQDDFLLNIIETPPSIIGDVLDSFIDFLPKGDSFSNLQKIFIVIGFLILSSLIMIIGFKFPFNLTTFINILLFIVLVVLGFVPLGMLIVVLLSIIGIIILRVK